MKWHDCVSSLLSFSIIIIRILIRRRANWKSCPEHVAKPSPLLKVLLLVSTAPSITYIILKIYSFCCGLSDSRSWNVELRWVRWRRGWLLWSAFLSPFLSSLIFFQFPFPLFLFPPSPSLPLSPPPHHIPQNWVWENLVIVFKHWSSFSCKWRIKWTLCSSVPSINSSKKKSARSRHFPLPSFLSFSYYICWDNGKNNIIIFIICEFSGYFLLL